MSADEYLLQDRRSYCGNDLLWWSKKGGYTTDFNEAEIFTKEWAIHQNNCRSTDIPWPRDYVKTKLTSAVDSQNVCLEDALEGTNIRLKKNSPQKYKAEIHRCQGCGRFLSNFQIYGSCDHCNTVNY